MQKLKATDLVVDFTLYPRGDVDSQHVGYMVRSLEAGHSLPPILVDEKSKRIVDGVHRWKAHQRFAGEDVEIECVLRAYPSDADLFLDAARLNAAHGSSLTTFDRVKCLLRADELGIKDESIADALKITVEMAGELRRERAGRLRSGPKVSAVPLKRTISHMAGRTLSRRQLEINDRLGGMNALFYANQLVMLLEGNLIDLSNEKLLAELEKLQGLTAELLGSVKASGR